METNAQYEARSLAEAGRRLKEIESAPLSERKEAQADFFEAMKDTDLIGERLHWLIQGNYGYGEMLKAKQVLTSPRMNQKAALSQMIAAYEWHCPAAMAAAAWNKLTRTEQEDLDRELDRVIQSAQEDQDDEAGETIPTMNNADKLIQKKAGFHSGGVHHGNDWYAEKTRPYKYLEKHYRDSPDWPRLSKSKHP